jgi:hypothetical protein
MQKSQEFNTPEVILDSISPEYAANMHKSQEFNTPDVTLDSISPEYAANMQKSQEFNTPEVIYTGLHLTQNMLQICRNPKN